MTDFFFLYLFFGLALPHKLVRKYALYFFLFLIEQHIEIIAFTRFKDFTYIFQSLTVQK